MHIRINSIVNVYARGTLLVTLLGTLLASTAASASSNSEPNATDDDRRWIPHFAISTGAKVQPMDASVVSQCANGRPTEEVQFGTPMQPRFEDRQACADPAGVLDTLPVTELIGNLRPTDEDETDAVTPFVGYTLGLSTPRLGSQPWAPRVFLSGEAITFFGPERDVAKEGSPSVLGLAEGEASNAAGSSAASLFGVGSRTSAEVQTLGWGARLGLAFPFEFRGRRLWLKPAFGWINFEIDVEGEVVAGLKDDPFPADGFGPGIREVTLSGSSSDRFDGIGPSIELEMEAGRFGPIGVSVFANISAFHILGNRSIEFSSSLDCPAFDPGNPTGGCAANILEPVDLNNLDVLTPVLDADFRYGNDVPLEDTADTYSADWSFEVDDWGYRGGLGIRFHWLGR